VLLTRDTPSGDNTVRSAWQFEIRRRKTYGTYGRSPRHGRRQPDERNVTVERVQVEVLVNDHLGNGVSYPTRLDGEEVVGTGQDEPVVCHWIPATNKQTTTLSINQIGIGYLTILQMPLAFHILNVNLLKKIFVSFDWKTLLFIINL